MEQDGTLINITVTDPAGNMLSSGLVTRGDTTIEILKTLIELEARVPHDKQIIIWNQKNISNHPPTTTLTQLGMSGDTVLLLAPQPLTPQAAQQQQQQQQQMSSGTSSIQSSSTNASSGLLPPAAARPPASASASRASPPTGGGGGEQSRRRASAGMFDFSNISVDPSTNQLILQGDTSTTGARATTSPPSAAPSSEPPAEEDALKQAREMLEVCGADPATLADFEARHPMLGEALRSRDEQKVVDILKQNIERRKKEVVEHQRRMAVLAADPLSVEAQRILEEEVHQKAVDEQLSFAQEHMPEVFGRVVMLYVNIEVNGIAIKAFVDSGAQATIMSKRFADKCNLLRMVDKRFKGVAHGVGTSTIMGRIHTAQIKIGTEFFAGSITVLEDDKMDFLFGLDMLRRHQMCIDLKNNVLRTGDIEVPFLGEGELKEILERESGMQERLLASEANKSTDNVTTTTSTTNTGNSTSSSGSSSSGSDSSGSNESSQSLEEKLQFLMSLGFNITEAQGALQQTGGNTDTAASLLFAQIEMP
eukprot:GHVQ01001176.1.p1 GENE.GHVQ01001176.1~~GHVQ01001176.1.p1  ORF type:complete len:535 (+),score=122.15 GHVQ01001176.1:420-2024(+)